MVCNHPNQLGWHSSEQKGNNKLNNEKLVEILKKLLKTDVDMSFLLQLEKTELETLIACIRDRVENFC